MLNKKKLHLVKLVIPIMAIIVILSGCATKKNLWGDPETGLILKYRMEENQPLKYKTTNEFIMNMVVMDQKFEITSEAGHSFTVLPVGTNNKNFKVNITIDTMFMKMVSPRGDIVPDMKDVIGEGFEMSLTELGKEYGYVGADMIKYSLGLSDEERSVASEFQAIFPDLPGNPVKIGDKWTSMDTVTETSENGELSMIFTNINTLSGFEEVNGKECIKITVDFTGDINGKGKEQGVDLITTGEMEGRNTWYFAYKEGTFVKMITEGKAVSTTEVPSQNMTIPSTRDYSMVMELIN